MSLDIHKIHHHNVLAYTDSYYGGIFRIHLYMEHEEIVYGVDAFPDEKTNSDLVELLKQPFQEYKKTMNLFNQL